MAVVSVSAVVMLLASWERADLDSWSFSSKAAILKKIVLSAETRVFLIATSPTARRRSVLSGSGSMYGLDSDVAFVGHDEKNQIFLRS